MAIQLLEYSDAKIYTFPTTINKNEHREVTVGDLHANAIKLLYFLIQQGVFYFKENPEANYARMAAIYSAHGELLEQLKIEAFQGQKAFSERFDTTIVEMLRGQIDEFVTLLNHLEVADNPPRVRLIGDEMADRGHNDYFVLKILELMANKGVDTHINLSNHGDYFINYYERDTDEANAIQHVQFGSVGAMDYCIRELDLIDKEEVHQIIQNIYKPALKTIDYSLNQDGITLFTHAPVGFFVIKKIAERLGIDYNDSSKEALARTLEAMNRTFHEDYVSKDKIKELTTRPQDLRATSFSQLEKEDKQRVEASFYYLIWNRWTDEQEEELLRPASVNGYKVSYVHGHDSFIPAISHVCNLDTDCGKSSQLDDERDNYPELFRFLVLESDEGPLKQFLEQQGITEDADSESIAINKDSDESLERRLNRVQGTTSSESTQGRRIGFFPPFGGTPVDPYSIPGLYR